MNEVYTLIDNAFSLASGSVRRIELLREVVNMELFHIREYPDSTNSSRARLMSYLARRQPVLASGMAAEFLALKAEYFSFAGYTDSADLQYEQLEQYYGSTAAYRQSLHTRLSNAFVAQDSIGIDKAISAMTSSSLDSSTIRLARSERRAYYRCRKSGMMPKRKLDGRADMPQALSIEMSVYPNPWTVSTALTFTLPEEMAIRVKLLTLDGRELCTLVDGLRHQGEVTVPVNPGTLPAGVYLCLLEAKRYSGLARIVLLR
jgi:hypothetical protein